MDEDQLVEVAKPSESKKRSYKKRIDTLIGEGKHDEANELSKELNDIIDQYDKYLKIKFNKIAENNKLKLMSYFTRSPSTNRRTKSVFFHNGRFFPFEPKENMYVWKSIISQEFFDYESFEKTLCLNQFSMNSCDVGRDLRKEASLRITISNANILFDEPPYIKVLKCRSKDDSNVLKFQFLQFYENNRPAYFGSFAIRVTTINLRRNPFKFVESVDYEVDSDEEWEDIESGDEVAFSEEEDANEQDNIDPDEFVGFMVPHGYLSDDEGIKDESDNESREKVTDSGDIKFKKLSEIKPFYCGVTYNIVEELPEEVILMLDPEFYDMKLRSLMLKSFDSRNPNNIDFVVDSKEIEEELRKFVNSREKVNNLQTLCKGFLEYWKTSLSNKKTPTYKGTIDIMRQILVKKNGLYVFE